MRHISKDFNINLSVDNEHCCFQVTKGSFSQSLIDKLMYDYIQGIRLQGILRFLTLH